MIKLIIIGLIITCVFIMLTSILSTVNTLHPHNDKIKHFNMITIDILQALFLICILVIIVLFLYRLFFS